MLEMRHHGATNLGAARRLCAGAALLLIAAALLIPSKAVFLTVGAIVVLGTLGLVRRSVSQEPMPVYAGAPSVLAVLAHSLGFLGSVAAYGYLALTDTGLERTHADFASTFLSLALSPPTVDSGKQEVLRWGLTDKRPLFFAYLISVALIAYTWLVTRLDDSKAAGQPPPPVARGWAGRLGGALLIALLVYAWVDVPALRAVTPGLSDGLSSFHDIHNYVHLSGLQQIRDGALPFIDAQTQYGLGNQALMAKATNAVHFSLHGFAAANTLINAVCAIVFFVFLQQMLGTGWALLCLAGWLILPSPLDYIIDMPAGALMTRWLAVPVLSVLLAHLLANGRTGTWGAICAGIIWGLGAFLSQESMSGGFLVFALSLMLFAPLAGRGLAEIVRFSLWVAASAVLAYVVSTAGVVGLGNVPNVLALGSQKPALVMAGVSNAWWSDPLTFMLSLEALNGIFEGGLKIRGNFAALLLTYGGALFVIVVAAILARYLTRRYATADDRARGLAAKFGGVTVGTFVLLSFGLLRSDAAHVASPAFLMPLFLLMFPAFVWHCLDPGFARAGGIASGLILIVAGLFAGEPKLHHVTKTPVALWHDSVRAMATYENLRQARGQPWDFVARYSPLPEYQLAFRKQADFAVTEELFSQVHAAAKGRPVELSFYRLNALISSPELFYFYGGIRSISGIVSPMITLWLRSDEEAWITRVAGAERGCLLVVHTPKDRLTAAWGTRATADQPLSASTTLSCRLDAP